VSLVERELSVPWFILILVENVGGYPHPGWFLAKSAEPLENKRVEFSMSAKKCNGVRKSVKGKEIGQNARAD